MNKKIIWIKIEVNSYYNLLLKLNNIGINVYDIKKLNDYILIKTLYSDYKRIKKYLVTYKVSIYSYTGLEKIKLFLKKYWVFTITNIIGIIMLLCVNNLIFKVEIKTNNANIKNLLIEELEKYNLTKMRFKKSHKNIEIIVKDILKNNKDKIKWLEIKYDGLVMIVNVTETISENINDEYPNCNIIASKDAKISSLNVYRGIALKEINDYVMKNDIILSGSITHNEEVKNTVCASGEVYGEVWYKVKVEVPFEETKKEYTGKNRYNLNIKINDNIYNIFKSRIKIKDEKITNLYKLNDFEINLVKEKEYIEKKSKISVDDAYNKGITLAIEKINLLLDEDEKIIDKKVLKKEVNDSTIYLEIFIVVKENIGTLQVLDEEVENDIGINGENN